MEGVIVQDHVPEYQEQDKSSAIEQQQPCSDRK